MSDAPTPMWSSQGDAPPAEPVAMDPQVGRFSLAEELGRGGMGIVYRAWDVQLGREVALKTLSAGRLASPGEKARLLREARAAASLSHPNIVPLYDCLEQDGLVYLAMRLIRGPSLAQQVRERGPMAPRDAARVVAKLARALEHAHGLGFVHRDVKPGNVLMEGDEPYLTDFGLVRIQQGDNLELTGSAQLLGTPAYMAPEQIRGGGRSAVPASDQYALGVVLDELLRGGRPFTGDTPGQVLASVLERRRPALPATVPAELGRVVERALEEDPARRFPSAGDMAAALERWLDGERVFPAAEQAARAARGFWAKGRIPLVILLAAGLLLGLDRLGLRLSEERAAAERDARAEQRRLAMEAAPPEDAERLFDAFVALPEVQDTPALARAWLARGEALRSAGDDEQALRAMTTAYGVASDEQTQTSALLALAGALRARERWGALRSVVRLLRRHLPEADPSLRPLERDLAVTVLDVPRAVALNDDPALAPLLSALDAARPIDVKADLVSRWDVDSDGVEEVGFYDSASRSLTLLRTGEPSLPAVATFSDLPNMPRVAQGGSSVAVLRSPGECALVIPREGRLEALKRWPCAASSALAAGDLEGDGRASFYHAQERALLTASVDGPDAPVGAETSINASNSEVRDLLIADLDGDGRSELAVAMGGWGAYDLRILNKLADGLHTAARTRIGELWEMATLRTAAGTLVAVTQEHDPSKPLNLQVFPEGSPQGGAAGVYLFAWQGGRLEPRGLLPWPQPEALPGEVQYVRSHGNELFTGDLDGDGRDELALGIDDTWTVLYRQRADGSWASVTLQGRYPLAFADLDRDGDDELLTWAGGDGGAVWAFGTGHERPPRLTEATRDRTPPPEGIDPDLAAAWQRAEDLVEMGALETAADRLRALSRMAAGTPASGPAMLRAGALLEAAGRRAEAVALYTEAAEDPALAPTALEAALRIDREDRRFTDAIAFARRRLALPDPPAGLAAQIEDLQALSPASSLAFDFRPGDPTTALTGPSARWVLDTPLAVRRVQEGLRIGSTGRTRVLHIPLRWSGGPARVELSLLAKRIDWGNSAVVGLVGRDGQKGPSILLRTVGGGGVYYHGGVSCSDGPDGGGTGLVEGEAKKVVWELSPSDGRASCTQFDPAGEERGRIVYKSLVPIPGSDLDLIVGSDEGGVSDIVLQRISLAGFTLRDEPRPDSAEVNGRVAEGRPTEAIALAGPGSGAHLARLLALQQSGRAAEAKRALAEALRGEPDLADRLLLLLPDRFGQPLQEVLGARYFAIADRAWELLALMHPESEAATSAFTRWLGGVERAPPELRVRLLTWRAQAWRYRGQLTLAASDINAALSGHALATTWREAAIIRAAQGDDEGAMAAVLAALQVAPSPEIFANRLDATPELAHLRTLPAWSAVTRAEGEDVW